VRTFAAWYDDDDDLLLFVAAALRPGPLTRDDVVAAGRAAYKWLPLTAVCADLQRLSEAGGNRSTRPPPPD
jgi:hypothetical protein